MAEEILAYCVKEKTKKPMKDAHEVTLKNGKKALQGVCASCGTKMMKFISSKKSASDPHEEAVNSNGNTRAEETVVQENNPVTESADMPNM